MSKLDISAVVLSSRTVTLRIPGVTVLPYVSSFTDATGLFEARMAALRCITTKWFFFLDDDDELPSDYLSVLDECVSAGTVLAYTNEMVGTTLRKSRPYTQQRFINDPLLIHHLAVCDTKAARQAAQRIPRGCYMVENLLFFQVAKQGATYIDRVGYIWNKKNSGLHKHPSLLIGQVQSSTWAARNRE